jgi:site-specific DNA-methyltransferase (adenine-specific)
MLETNKIYLGDCLDTMKQIDDQSIDMILCDLPYGTTQCKWDSVIPIMALWARYKRIVKKDGAIVLTCQQPFTSHLIMSAASIYRYNWVWRKSKATGFLDAKRRPLNNIEDIAVFSIGASRYFPQMTEGKAHKNGVNTRNKRVEVYNSFVDTPIYESNAYYPQRVIEFAVEQKPIHPTQKPVPLFEYLIRTYTNENDLVLDNCIGSGTTAIACINTNRRYIGIEKDEKYYEIANNRIAQYLATVQPSYSQTTS